MVQRFISKDNFNLGSKCGQSEQRIRMNSCHGAASSAPSERTTTVLRSRVVLTIHTRTFVYPWRIMQIRSSFHLFAPLFFNPESNYAVRDRPREVVLCIFPMGGSTAHGAESNCAGKNIL
jgi:hypothetical protein